MTHVLVIGAGPAGVLAAFRAADLGVRTVLVTMAPSEAWPPTMGRFRSEPSHTRDG